MQMKLAHLHNVMLECLWPYCTDCLTVRSSSQFKKTTELWSLYNICKILVFITETMETRQNGDIVIIFATTTINFRQKSYPPFRKCVVCLVIPWVGVQLINTHCATALLAEHCLEKSKLHASSQRHRFLFAWPFTPFLAV